MGKKSIDDLKKGIFGWLSTKGYPLEMEVSKTFLDHSYGIRQGWYYEDPETNKLTKL